jgi:hypothetical protein
LDVFGDTSTRNQRGPPSTSFSPEESSFTPLGFGCARLATLALAPPRPKGVKLEGRRAIYRNGFTPTFDICIINVVISNLQTFKPSNLQTFKPSNLQTFKPSNLQTFKPSNLQT